MYRLEVFKAGTHTAMNGTTKTYSVEDLQNMAEKYNTQSEHQAPLVLGHPTVDDPAYGWAEKFEVIGQKLYAIVDQVSDKLKDAVKAGMFKKVSLAIFADGLIRHIGLLGATPPAVKGLTPVQFAGDKEFVEFAWATDENRVPVIGTILRSLRDFFIDKFDLDTADKILPSDRIDRLMDNPDMTYIPTNGNSNFATIKQEDLTHMEKAEFDNFKKDFDEFKATVMAALPKIDAFAGVGEALQALSTQVTTLVTTQEKLAKENAASAARAEFAAHVDSLIAEGKVLPAEKDGIMTEYAAFCKADSLLQYAEGEKTLLAGFKERLAARALQVKRPGAQFATAANAARGTKIGEVPAEFANAGTVQSASIELDAQIQAYADERKCSYAEAAVHFGADLTRTLASADGE